MFAINTDGGYIVGIVAGVSAKNSNATEDEYLAVKAMLTNAPDAPEGYTYRLREDLEWELCSMAVPEIQEATEDDYIDALTELGVLL